MKSRSQILSSLLILFFVNACTCNAKKEKTNEIVFENLKEGDTLVVKFAPKNLKQWFEFYSNKESTISLSDFSCSGVVLHREALKLIDTLYDKSSNRQNQLLVFSPDGHKFIDLFSVSSQTRHDSDIVRSLITPDADQQVVLGYSDGKRYELMYLGPEQVVETADWINDEQFVLTLITNENGNTIAELYLLDIKNSIFTNFRLSKKLTETQPEKQSFIEVWTNHNQKK